MGATKRDAVIAGMARTAIAKGNGALRDVPPEDYAGLVIKAAIQRAGLADHGLVDEVIFGDTLAAAGCVARVAALKAGLPVEVPALTVDRQCGSGSTALHLAAVNIRAGEGDLYVAGGVESMTRQPFLLEKPAVGYHHSPPVWISPRPLAPKEVGDPPMGITAENVAQMWEVGRAEQDEFALLSQEKAARAMRTGCFAGQIAPVPISDRQGEAVVFDVDEHPRSDVTLEALAKLRPIYLPDGTITAGNCTGINDGAAALLIAARERAEELGLPVLAKVRAFAAAGVDPNIMGIGPVPATRKALARAGLSIADVDVIELNESFAAQAIACCRELGIDWRDEALFNPNGGAIALGHPIAATLAILVVKAVAELERRSARYALVTACCGGGQGIATILERC